MGAYMNVSDTGSIKEGEIKTVLEMFHNTYFSNSVIAVWFCAIITKLYKVLPQLFSHVLQYKVNNNSEVPYTSTQTSGLQMAFPCVLSSLLASV